MWLSATPASFVSDVTVLTGLDGAGGTVAYEVEAEGAEGLEVRVALRDASGAEVARASGAAGELHGGGRASVAARGRATCTSSRSSCGATATLGRRLLAAVGVRTVEVDGARFLINGEPFYFKGFGKHEDSAVRGKGHDNAFMVHDFALMEWLGANSFRTSHYPYAEEVLDYADRHGVVVIDETAAVGLNMGLAAGIFGGQGVPDLLGGRRSTTPRRPSTGRRSASSSRATRTTRASCCGASPTSPSPTPPRRAPTSSRSPRRRAGWTRRARSASRTCSWRPARPTEN